MGDEMWCTLCNIPLSVKFIKTETQIGLASILDVICFQCSSIYQVRTNKLNKSRRLYDVNCKAAICKCKNCYDIQSLEKI